MVTSFNCQQPPEHLTWPEVDQNTRPWTRWWWHGSSVTPEGITAELESLRNAGFGGVEVTPIYGVIGDEEHFVSYLSDQWNTLLKHTINEAARLGLGVDMATGTGWPFGGPSVADTDASKYYTSERWTIDGGETVQIPLSKTQEPVLRTVNNQVYQLYSILKDRDEVVEGSQTSPPLLENVTVPKIEEIKQPVSSNKNLQALAIDQVRFENPLEVVAVCAFTGDGRYEDLLTNVDDSEVLNWDAPEGKWTLYTIYQGLHGKMVERAAPGGEGLVIDHFSEEATQAYLDYINDAFGSLDISGLRAFFNDSYEVDDARGQADWTSDFFDSFEALRGYDIREYWNIFQEESPPELANRIRSDYRQTLSDLLLKKFTETWTDWTHQQNAISRNQAHGSPANILDLYAASDIPETEGTELLRIKFASSAAHLTGKALVSAEAATWLDEHFLTDFQMLKENVDRYFVGGVNHIVYHGTCYSPQEMPWPGRLFYAAVHVNNRNPLWHVFPEFNKYVARVQSFMQEGQADNDILLYFPIHDKYAEKGNASIQHFDGGSEENPVNFNQAAHLLDSLGYGYDIVSDALLQTIHHRDFNLESHHKEYKTLIIPQCEYIPFSTWQHIFILAESGATIIVEGKLPRFSAGFYNWEEHEEKLGKTYEHINQQMQNGFAESTVGRGKIIIASTLDPLLGDLGIDQELMTSHGLKFHRRILHDTSIYFISNGRVNDVDEWITLAKEMEAVTFFDPVSGRIGTADSRRVGARFEVRVQLRKGESIILREGMAEDVWSYSNSFYVEGKKISGPWNISFQGGGPQLPPVLTSDTLLAWTSAPGESFRSYSGTGIYQTTFTADTISSDYSISIGRFHNAAIMYVNDSLVGPVFGPSNVIRIPERFLKRENELRIEVSNLMANRIRKMDLEQVFWKRFYNVNFPSRRAENRGPDGLFTARNWDVRPSGLKGPVRLIKED